MTGSENSGVRLEEILTLVSAPMRRNRPGIAAYVRLAICAATIREMVGWLTS